MNAENTKKLLDRFKFFHPERPPQQGLMCFGFECGDGWFQIVWDLCERIDHILQMCEACKTYHRGEPFEVVQVKEKFGSLRFYVNWGSDDMHAAISGAEERSVKTCEACGQPGERRNTGGWLLTLCDACDAGRHGRGV